MKPILVLVSGFILFVLSRMANGRQAIGTPRHPTTKRLPVTNAFRPCPPLDLWSIPINVNDISGSPDHGTSVPGSQRRCVPRQLQVPPSMTSPLPTVHRIQTDRQARQAPLHPWAISVMILASSWTMAYITPPAPSAGQFGGSAA